MDSGSSVHICPYDALPCDRYIPEMGFGACYTASLSGKVESVCPRFRIKSDVEISLDVVPKFLIPK